jgi:hypothetical protein
MYFSFIITSNLKTTKKTNLFCLFILHIYFIIIIIEFLFVAIVITYTKLQIIMCLGNYK